MKRLASPLSRLCRLSLALAPLALIGLVPTFAQAANIVVDTNVDAIDDAQNCSLREAVIAANTNTAVDGCTAGEAGLDTIEVPEGVYTLTITGLDEAWIDQMGGYGVNTTPDASVGDLDILEDIEIIGAGSATTIIEWGDVKDRIFHVQAPVDDVIATMSGLTLRAASVEGGVINPNDPPASQWLFSRHGGALAVGVSASAKLLDESGPSDSGNSEEEDPTGTASLIISDCVISESHAGGDGGGMYAAGPVTATNVVFSDNLSEANGGAIYNDGEASYTSCAVINNTGENGGGMFDTGSHATLLAGCTFSGNQAVGGAGLATRALVDSSLVNCTFSGNMATDIGGGLLTNGSVDLQNSTIVANSSASDASFASGGLSSFGSGGYTLNSTLIAANVVGEMNVVANCGCTGGGGCVNSVFTSSGFNLEDGETCNLDQGTDLINTEPELMALGAYGGPVSTHALSLTSPALDVASQEQCPATDARGAGRPGGDVCDIGAFELSPDELDGDADGFCVGLMLGEDTMCLDGSMVGDCDDSEMGSFPGNAELCDGIDNDCNGEVDDGLDVFEYWPDTDNDGFGDADADPVMVCSMPEGFTDNANDCDDSMAGVNPDAEEVCDNMIDDNCDGQVDEGCETTDTTTGDGDTTTDTGGDEVGTDTGETGGATDGGGDDCNCTSSDERNPSGLAFGLLALGFGLTLRRRR